MSYQHKSDESLSTPGRIGEERYTEQSEKQFQNLDQSGISNFSLEFEMLNKLQVTKNNHMPLKNLPVISADYLISEYADLYKEEVLADGRIKFSTDERDKIIFEDPFKRTTRF